MAGWVQELVDNLQAELTQVHAEIERLRGEFAIGRQQLTQAEAERDVALSEAQAAEQRAEALAGALRDIRENQGRVCEEFEICRHVACASSCASWFIADAALKGEAPAPAGRVATDALVIRFAEALAAKLRRSSEKYGYTDEPWQRDDWRSYCITALNEHVTKGDPLDVAAYCAFAWHHGWSVAPSPAPAGRVVLLVRLPWPLSDAIVSYAEVWGVSLEDAVRRLVESYATHRQAASTGVDEQAALTPPPGGSDGE